MFRPPDTFTTEHLLARRPRVEDAPAVLAAYAGDPEVTRFLAWKAYERVELLAEFLHTRAGDWEQGGNHFAWLLCLRGTDDPIGSIGCLRDGGKVMCGYVFGKKFWGRGLATEALRVVVGWTLAQPEIFRVWAFCDVENPASARVMEKAGLVREGVLRRWHVCPTLGPELRDCFVHAKVK